MIKLKKFLSPIDRFLKESPTETPITIGDKFNHPDYNKKRSRRNKKTL